MHSAKRVRQSFGPLQKKELNYAETRALELSNFKRFDGNSMAEYIKDRFAKDDDEMNGCA